MYLNFITLSRTLPCPAEPGKIIVIGKPDRVLDEVIPYLATLPGVISYNPDACTLTFRRRPGFCTLYSDKVTITKVRDFTEGLDLLTALRDAVNAVWERRDELVAITIKRAPLTTCKFGSYSPGPTAASAARQLAWLSQST